MANKFKGEVSFEAGGQPYKLSFSANALCELEDAMGITLDEVIKLMQSPDKLRLRDLRQMFWAALLDHQPETTFANAKIILSKVSAVEMGELVGKAFVLSMPSPEDVEGGGRPPMPGGHSAGPAS